MKTVSLLVLLFSLALSAGAQTFSMLYAFGGPPVDGANPWGGLVHDSAGNLYGTSETGGTGPCACGAIFKLDPSGHETILYNFTGGFDAGFPQSSLIRDNAGNLYGTAHQNFPSGPGTLFKFDTSGTLTVLYAFTGGTDGGDPIAQPIRDASGNLYGTTNSGGDLSCSGGGGCGVVYKVSPSGQETVLHAFHGGQDGAYLVASLVMDSAGNLYGTAPTGGNTSCNAPYGCGIVFRVDPTGRETVIHRFSGVGGDGSFPYAGLVFDASGNLYGTTSEGGVNGGGIVFKIDRSGHQSVLFSFNGNDGAYPVANMIIDKAGNLYGTTEYGGISLGFGVAFKISPTGVETVLHSFQNTTDGGAPLSPLMFNQNALYGTTSNWGPSTCNQFGCGTVFKIAR